MGTFILLCALASTSAATPSTEASSAALTPEQQIDAWDPRDDQVEHAAHSSSGVDVAVVSVLAPLAATVAGVGAGGISVAVASQSLGSGGFFVGGLVGLAAFDAVYAGALQLLLPPGFAPWSVVIAVAAVDIATLAAGATAYAVNLGYIATFYAGSDCICGQDVFAIWGLGTAFVVATAVGSSVITLQLLRPDDVGE